MLMMVILFVLGMFIDWVGILLLTVPIFLPIMKSLEWSTALFGLPGVAADDVPLWYGVIFMVNMQMAFLSSAIRLFAVLSEKRRAAGDHHGDDLPRGGAISWRCNGSASGCAFCSRRSSSGCPAFCTRGR